MSLRGLQVASDDPGETSSTVAIAVCSMAGLVLLVGIWACWALRKSTSSSHTLTDASYTFVILCLADTEAEKEALRIADMLLETKRFRASVVDELNEEDIEALDKHNTAMVLMLTEGTFEAEECIKAVGVALDEDLPMFVVSSSDYKAKSGELQLFSGATEELTNQIKTLIDAVEPIKFNKQNPKETVLTLEAAYFSRRLFLWERMEEATEANGKLVAKPPIP